MLNLKHNCYQIFIPGKPIPQGSKSATVVNGRAVMFEANKNLTAWRKTVKKGIEAYFEAIGFTGVSMIDPTRPVTVHITFVFDKPKSNKTDWMMQKPDVDKLARAVLDACTESGVIKDDSKITQLNLMKVWTSATPTSNEEGCWLELTWWD